MAQGCAARYRARNPRAPPLYRLFETHFDEVRGQWEERFERRCGFWRGFVDEQVRRYLDRGLFENGFARIRCPNCAEEYLLAFSCKTRELCPSCAAKRSAATAALLAEEVFTRTEAGSTVADCDPPAPSRGRKAEDGTWLDHRAWTPLTDTTPVSTERLGGTFADRWWNSPRRWPGVAPTSAPESAERMYRHSNWPRRRSRARRAHRSAPRAWRWVSRDSPWHRRRPS